MDSRSVFGRRSRMPYSGSRPMADGRQRPGMVRNPTGSCGGWSEGALAPSIVERSEHWSLTYDNGAPADAGGGMATHAYSEDYEPLTGGQPQLNPEPQCPAE